MRITTPVGLRSYLYSIFVVCRIHESNSYGEYVFFMTAYFHICVCFCTTINYSYVGIYLKEEVQAEGIVRNVGDFARFLEAMSFSHGSLINSSNISRECQ